MKSSSSLLLRPGFVVALLAVVFLSGCYSRKEAALVTARLGAASEKTGLLVTKLAEADADNVKALQELHQAFLTAQQQRALATVELKQNEFLQVIGTNEAALYRDVAEERARFIGLFFTQVNESMKPLRAKETELAAAAVKAKKAREEFPNDKDRQLASLQADAQYIALAYSIAQLAGEAGRRAYADADEAVEKVMQASATAANDARQKIRAAAESSRSKIRAATPPVANLPGLGTESYKALSAYVTAVRASSDQFALYLQSNSLATNSFAASFLKGFGENIVGAVTDGLQGKAPKASEAIKEAKDIGKLLYGDVLADNDTNGKAILELFGSLTEKTKGDLLASARATAENYITKQLTILQADKPAPAK